MNQNNGFLNEQEIVNYLNLKKFGDLNDNFKRFLLDIFNRAIPDDAIILSAKHNKTGQKPDIVISTLGQSRFISVKRGNGNSVHQENIHSFVRFLANHGIDEDTQQSILRLHWSDGTTDNSGVTRFSAADYRVANQSDLDILNDRLSDQEIIRAVANRVLFSGKDPSYATVDYIYHGTLSDGLWASRDQILDYIDGIGATRGSLSFGPLTFQIWNANIGRRADMEPRRLSMQIKWGGMAQDLRNIMNSRTNE